MFQNRPYLVVPLGGDTTIQWSGPADGVSFPIGGIAGWTLAMYVVLHYDPNNPSTGNPALLTLPLTITDDGSSSGMVKFQGTISSAQSLAVGEGARYYSVWRTDVGFTDELASNTIVFNPTARRY